MAMPRWWGHINKRLFNPRELRNGRRPVLTHVGRSSGRTYRTPLDAHRVGDTYHLILVYGSGCDWARNVLHAGSARLQVDGEDIELTRPRVETGPEAWDRLPAEVKRPPRFLGVTEMLVLDIVTDG